jgi:hypothetical protein
MRGSPSAKAPLEAADCWLVTAAINISATGTYVLSWKSDIDSPSYYASGGKNSVWMSKTSNVTPGDFQKIWEPTGGYGTSAGKLTLNEAVNFSATAGDTVYLAFRKQGAGAHYWFLDDILLEKRPDNDLQIIAGFPYNSPYTQIPLSQNIFSGNAVNNGGAVQTGVRFLVSVNGVLVDSSASVPTLAAGDTSLDLTVDNVSLSAGNNIVTCAVVSNEEEEKPEDNSVTFSIKTSASLYAADNLMTFTNGTGSTEVDDYAVGQIYKIVKPTTLSGALIGFKDGTPMDVKIGLYRMVADDEVDNTPVASATVTRTTSGLNLFAFPDTVTLAVGDYFLSVQQLSMENMGLAYQSGGTRYEKSYEILEPKVGAAAVRLVLKTSDCTPLTGLYANVGYKEVVFSWNTGNAFLYRLTVSQGDSIIGTYTTTDTTLTVSYLQSGTEYSYQITAFCDASMQTQTQKMTFSTKICVEQVIVFPFIEDFETSTSSCWTYDFNGNNELDFPSRRFDNTGENHLESSHSGSYGWRFSSEKSDNDPSTDDSYSWLITPELVQTTGNKTLNFWYKGNANLGNASMCVGYSTTDNDLNNFTFNDTVSATSSWKQFSQDVPGDVKYIAFYFIDKYRKLIYIDDIVIDMADDAPFEFISTNIVDNAQNISINTDFRAYFTDTIDITGSNDNIVFKDENDMPVLKQVQAQGKVLTVTPVSALEYNKTYTVIIPVSYIENHDEEISVTFTTELLSVGVNTFPAAKAFSSVFPVLCKGNLMVTTASKATVDIFNFSGMRLKSFVSNGKLNIDLNYTNGIYFVVVRASDKERYTHKIILQR